MWCRSRKAFVAALAISALTAMLSASGAAAADGPFSGMSGNWSGPGTISLSSGSKERIRCRANYNAETSGVTLEASIRCASDSYKFELQVSASYANGAVTGYWSEASRGVAGTLSGTASSGRIQANATGPYLSAKMLLTTRGNSQSISIQSPGTEIANVSISLNK
jgi:hypothetical protein